MAASSSSSSSSSVYLAKPLLLLQLSILLCTFITVHGVPQAETPHSQPPHYHHQAPTPVQSPAQPPANPPTDTPQRKLVAVQGVVYCKSCHYRGVDSLVGATPLYDAVVKLQCNNTKYPLLVETKTDKNGYFFFLPLKMLTTSGSHKCKVSLVSSPNPSCAVPTNLRGGAAGASLIATPKSNQTDPKVKLFTVGPFAFEPHKSLPCSH